LTRRGLAGLAADRPALGGVPVVLQIAVAVA
jgi:hypothetical protein